LSGRESWAMAQPTRLSKHASAASVSPSSICR
jgi:hypothetical protein